MSITLTKNNSFRFEDNRTKPICVISSRSKNQHIITADITDKKSPTLSEDLQNKTSKLIRDSYSEHTNELHYKKNPESDEYHGHFKYPNRDTMLESLKQDFPKEAEMIINKLNSQETSTSRGFLSFFKNKITQK